MHGFARNLTALSLADYYNILIKTPRLSMLDAGRRRFVCSYDMLPWSETTPQMRQVSRILEFCASLDLISIDSVSPNFQIYGILSKKDAVFLILSGHFSNTRFSSAPLSVMHPASCAAYHESRCTSWRNPSLSTITCASCRATHTISRTEQT